jgi:uncharacterized protein YheU (UPF0270 family)
MSDAAQEPVDVPYTELPADLLQAVVESFVLREGTDYGEKELSLEDKVARVITQLKRGEAKIVFDPESASVTIMVGHRRIDGAPGR